MKFVIENFGALREALLKITGEIGDLGVPFEKVFDCKLVIDELVSNILQHEGGRAYLAVDCGEEIEIRVRGEGAFRPPAVSTCSAVDAERGRGLFLVDALALRRGYSDEEGIVVRMRR